MANTVNVLIKANSSGAVTEIRAVGDEAEKSGSRLSSAFGLAGKAILGLGAASVAGTALSVKEAAEFEHALDQVGAVANATKAEMKGLSDTALRIGKDTAFSATEAAGAMEMLASNGVSVADIMNGAADAAVNLAAAGGTDLAMAADTASTAMAVWGLQGKDMADVVNRLAGAANVSRFGVEDMAGAIAQGGGAAKTAGVEFGDFAAAIAAIAPSFSSGSDAGTSMKTMLAGLVPDTNSAAGAMRKLGIITDEGGNAFFTAKGELKSMAEIAGILNTATKDLTEQEKTLALSTIFGSDAMRAAAAMAGMTEEEFRKLQDTMGSTDAAAAAAQRMGNFKGALEELKGSIETIQIQIGTKLLPVLTDVVRLAADKLPGAAEAMGRLATIGWDKVIGPLSAVAQAVADIAEAGAEMAKVGWDKVIGPLGEVARTAVRFAESGAAAAVAVLKGLAQVGKDLAQVAWGAVSGPLGEIAGVIAEIASAGADRVAGWLKDIADAGTELATVDAPALLSALKDFATDSAAPALEGIARALKEMGEAKIEDLRPQLDALRVSLGEISLGDFAAAWDSVKEKVEPVVDALRPFVEQVLVDLKRHVQEVGQELAPLGEAFMELLAAFKPLEPAVTALLSLLEPFAKILGYTLVAAVMVFLVQLDLFVKALTIIIPPAVTVATAAIEAIARVLGKVNEAIAAQVVVFVGLFKGAFSAVEKAITEWPGKIRDALVGAWEAFTGFAGEVAGLFENLGKDAMAKMWSGLQYGWSSIVYWLERLGGKILGAVGAIEDILYDIGKAIVQGLWNGMQDVWGQLTSWIGGAVAALPGPIKKLFGISSPSTVFRDEIGKPLIQGMLAGIQEEWPKVEAFLVGAVSEIKSALAAPAALANGVTPMPWLPAGLPDYVYPEYTPGVGEMGFATMFGRRLPYRDVGGGFKAPVAEDGTVLWNHAISHNPVSYTNNEGRGVSAYVGPLGPADARAGGYTPPQVINLVVDGQVLAKVVNDNNARAGV